MLGTPRCDLLGIEGPIFAASMGYLTGPELAAAVNNARGLWSESLSRTRGASSPGSRSRAET
jgi:NAD(P)H-dependent flavin oxidoreductase YrpB (nitropropane dioxygenase family)